MDGVRVSNVHFTKSVLDRPDGVYFRYVFRSAFYESDEHDVYMCARIGRKSLIVYGVAPFLTNKLRPLLRSTEYGYPIIFT